MPVSGETNFAQLPQAMQQKIFEAHRLVMEHRRHAEGVGRFSTQAQGSGLEQHTKKLNLDIQRVQNAHAELALSAEELRKQEEWLRGHIQKLQAAESGLPQYPGGGGERRGEGKVTPDQLAVLIRLQNDALLKVAAQVAGVHEMVERVRSEWTSRAGSDLFEELDRLAEEEEERKRKAARLVLSSASASSMAPAPLQGGGGMPQGGQGAPLVLTAGAAGTLGGGLFGGGQVGGTPPQGTPAAGGFGLGGTQSVGFFGQSNPDSTRQTRSKRNTRR